MLHKELYLPCFLDKIERVGYNQILMHELSLIFCYTTTKLGLFFFLGYSSPFLRYFHLAPFGLFFSITIFTIGAYHKYQAISLVFSREKLFPQFYVCVLVGSKSRRFSKYTINGLSISNTYYRIKKNMKPTKLVSIEFSQVNLSSNLIMSILEVRNPIKSIKWLKLN